MTMWNTFFIPTAAGDGDTNYVRVAFSQIVSYRAQRANGVSTLYVTTADGVEHKIASGSARDYAGQYWAYLVETARLHPIDIGRPATWPSPPSP